ncbi:MAG: hypothetical protein LBT13_10720 [Treponema sp.]|jgi:hypothetical protein|nr:hypothetical protein [Treponema sp.]
MTSNKRLVTISDNSSFEAVLDKTCERLWGKKVQHSIRRIRELEADLTGMEQELDEWLRHKNENDTQ